MAVSNENKGKMFFGLTAGIIYILFAVMQILNGLGLGLDFMDTLMIPADVFGGFVLLVIGSIFIYGFKEMNSGIHEGVAFVYFGILMSLVFVIIYLAIMGANALSWYGLGLEDMEGWTPLHDMKPGLYLGLLSLLGLLAWKDKFAMKGLSKAGI